MSLKLQNTDINALDLYTGDINKAYLGSTLVYGSEGGEVLPIASYPLANNSNEAIGSTLGIDGVDTAMSYNGTEALFNGTTSYIAVADNSIFSFTDGVNDLPFTIEADVSVNDGSSFCIVTKGDSVPTVEYFIYYTGTFLQVTLRDGSSNSIVANTVMSFTNGVDYKIKINYIGNKLNTGISVFLDDVLQTSTYQANGTYTGMANLGGALVIGKIGNTSAHFLNGTMKNLKFYDYVK